MAKLLQSAAATKRRLKELSEDVEPSSVFLKKKLIKIPDDNQISNTISSERLSKSKKSKINKDISNQIQNESVIIKDNSSRKETIIYVGHLPHGFYEKEMRTFFSQFGDVKRLKLYRSKKTNRSKGYAFVEFDEEEVAKVVSEAMNGYMMQEKQLVCNVVPRDKLHGKMFKGSKIPDDLKAAHEESKKKLTS